MLHRHIRTLLLFGCFGAGITSPVSAQMADLVPTQVDVSSTASDCNGAISGTVEVTILNQGALDAPASIAMQVFEDRNDNGLFDVLDDTALGVGQLLGPLGVAAQATVTIPVTGELEFRGNRLHAWVDSNNAVAESIEHNNVLSSGRHCEAAPSAGIGTVVQKWHWPGPGPGSPLPNHANVIATPAVADLDLDGLPEVLVAATDSSTGTQTIAGALFVLNGEDGTEQFAIVTPTLHVNATVSPAVADIDADGFPEIVCVNATATALVCFEHDGSFKWLSSGGPLISIGWGGVSIADVDANGVPEVIFGRQVFDNAGSLLWTGSQSVSPLFGLTTAADVDLDGAPEVIIGQSVYESGGTLAWSAGTSALIGAIGQLDSDPHAELVFMTGGNLTARHHDGTALWGPVAVPGIIGSAPSPTLADIDGDGLAEIFFAARTELWAFEHDGTPKWSLPIADISSGITPTSAADLNGDGSAEVLQRDEQSFRIVAGANGAVLYSVSLSSCTFLDYPVPVDVDGDGRLEIVIGANTSCNLPTPTSDQGVFVFEEASDGWATGRAIWNQHTYHGSNVAEDATVSGPEPLFWLDPATNCGRCQGRSADVPPLPLPNLTATLTGSNLACPDEIVLTARVGNGGSAESGLVDVTVHDGDPAQPGSTVLGSTMISAPLAPGQYEDVMFLVPIPSGRTNLDITVTVDFAGVEAECDELDNACAQSVALTCEQAFLRGDCNVDGANDIADAVFLLGNLFPGAGGPTPIACRDACDTNDDGANNIADVIRLLASQFGMPADPLPPPVMDCGPDPTGADSLPCASFPACP